MAGRNLSTQTLLDYFNLVCRTDLTEIRLGDVSHAEPQERALSTVYQQSSLYPL